MKKRHAIICAILIGSLPLVSGCSDLSDTLGNFLPFLKSEPKKEEPVVHKLKPTEEIRTSIPAGFTPSAVVPVGDEGEVSGKPAAGGPNTNDTTADKKPPVAPEKQPPGNETAKKGDEAAAPPAGNDKEAKPPVTEAPKTPAKTPTGKVPGGAGVVSGEDIAMVALAPGSEAPTPSDLKPVDSLMDKEYVYDPTGKRDPFRPFNLKVEKKADVPPEELTPLQRYNLSQLKLTAIIYDSERETGIAMVEAPDKKGYNIIVGSEIGGGRVVRITETDIQVEMRYEDFYGNTEKRIETLKIAGGK